jgi:hypothetical protein
LLQGRYLDFAATKKMRDEVESCADRCAVSMDVLSSKKSYSGA